MSTSTFLQYVQKEPDSQLTKDFGERGLEGVQRVQNKVYRAGRTRTCVPRVHHAATKWVVYKTFLSLSFLQTATTRRMVRDLEAKVQDQEEELDEQAGRIQQLEQVTNHIRFHQPLLKGRLLHKGAQILELLVIGARDKKNLI